MDILYQGFVPQISAGLLVPLRGPLVLEQKPLFIEIEPNNDLFLLVCGFRGGYNVLAAKNPQF